MNLRIVILLIKLEKDNVECDPLVEEREEEQKLVYFEPLNYSLGERKAAEEEKEEKEEKTEKKKEEKKEEKEKMKEQEEKKKEKEEKEEIRMEKKEENDNTDEFNFEVNIASNLRDR